MNVLVSFEIKKIWVFKRRFNYKLKWVNVIIFISVILNEVGQSSMLLTIFFI
jgi:hypothetical protein